MLTNTIGQRFYYHYLTFESNVFGKTILSGKYVKYYSNVI